MDDKVFQLINERMDRMEDKIDQLIAGFWKRAGIDAAVIVAASIIFNVILTMIQSKGG